MASNSITIIGGGLAGSEAAYQLAKRGYKVRLFEMRPSANAYAHHSDKLGELVCSNSLKSDSLQNAAGLLKQEMRLLDSLIIKAADFCKVPAGQALAVDREAFSLYIDEIIRKHPNIEVVHQECSDFNPEETTIVATGPLTSEKLSPFLQRLLGNDYLYFYDAAAPLVSKDKIDFSKAYYKSRYDKAGGDDYINCPFTKDEFFTFYYALIRAERVALKAFEKEVHFEGCMPIESLAARGFKTLTFGPMKPVGLETSDGIRPYAVVQLRQDNQAGTMYNIVGFQTNLTFSEQQRVFRLIPGLEKVDFLRYGVMHRNTYINSPALLSPNLNLKKWPRTFIVGQLSGVEGYIESAAMGIIGALNALRQVDSQALIIPPKETIIGSLVRYISDSSIRHFQPMNANYGVLASPITDKDEIASQSINALKEWMKVVNI